MPKLIPLTYKGEVVGDVSLEIDDKGVLVKGVLYDSEKAAEILGPSIERVSIGFAAVGERYDEHTLLKVTYAHRQAGIPDQQAEDAINRMQNAGILFRERS